MGVYERVNQGENGPSAKVFNIQKNEFKDLVDVVYSRRPLSSYQAGMGNNQTDYFTEGYISEGPNQYFRNRLSDSVGSAAPGPISASLSNEKRSNQNDKLQKQDSLKLLTNRLSNPQE